jgi:hypothetical protein
MSQRTLVECDVGERAWWMQVLRAGMTDGSRGGFAHCFCIVAATSGAVTTGCRRSLREHSGNGKKFFFSCYLRRKKR